MFTYIRFCCAGGSWAGPTVVRLADGPIIVPSMDARMGSNIQGPSLIRVPNWIDNPLGKYYLYFGDHRGTYIKLAYADDITGPISATIIGSIWAARSLEQDLWFARLSHALPDSWLGYASPDIRLSN